MRKRSGDVAREHGDVLRRLHWRAWDASSPAPEVSDGEVLSVLPVLIGSGSVGVVWPRVRARFPAGSAVGAALEEAFRSQEAHNARVAEELGRVVARLRECSVEPAQLPVLIKGLAVARLYPAGVVRVAGDIDLVVPDGDYLVAQDVLSDMRLSFHADPESRRAYAARGRVGDRDGGDKIGGGQNEGDRDEGGRDGGGRDEGGRDGGGRDGGDNEYRPYGGGAEVDLHRFSTWYGARDERFFADAEAVEIGRSGATAGDAVPMRVLVPCVEDHLRVLCLHFLRHGAVRPMRLCDIAVMMEGDNEYRPYDWDRVLSGTVREVEQIAVVLRLAGELLGAAAGASPQPVLCDALPDALPGWLVPAVLRRWGEAVEMSPPFREEVRGDVWKVMPALRRRWPDPISATYRSGARFDGVPRMPIQQADLLRRAGVVARGAMSRRASALLRGPAG